MVKCNSSACDVHVSVSAGSLWKTSADYQQQPNIAN